MSLGLTLNEPQINLGLVKSPEHLIYEFHNYRLDSLHLMLYRDDDEVSLTPKQVETLLALIEKNGEIVSKDVLMERLWGDTVVEEANLIQNIHFLRKELGDGPNGKPMIETLRRRGYRFTGKLQNGGREVGTSKNANTAATHEWYQQRPIAVSLAVVGLLGLMIVASSFFFGSQAVAPPGRVHFAILPLKPIDSANRSDAYEVGIAESLIFRLNSINGFVARPLSAMRKYDSIDQDALAAGRDQKVDHVMASNYQVADGKFRITAQLINVASGQLVDSYRVEKPAGDIFALQDAVSLEIAKNLAARFGRTADGPAAKRGTTNDEAYRLYLQGKNLTMMRSSTYAKKAVEYLEQAIRLDPNFALAYAQMARAYRKIGASDEQTRIRVNELINKALALDPDLAEAYVARAEERLTYDWNAAAAEKDLVKALQLEPNNDGAHYLMGGVYEVRGRLDEALREIETAQAIDPGAVMYMFHRGRILYYARRYDDAISQYRLAIDLDDRFMQSHGWMLRAYEMKGDYAAAFEAFNKREERAGRMNPERQANLRKAFETVGWAAARIKWSEEEGSGMSYFDVARLQALTGNANAAFESLNRSVEKREWLMATMLVEPAFDSLRADPRFSALLKSLGLEKG